MYKALDKIEEYIEKKKVENIEGLKIFTDLLTSKFGKDDSEKKVEPKKAPARKYSPSSSKKEVEKK